MVFDPRKNPFSDPTKGPFISHFPRLCQDCKKMLLSIAHGLAGRTRKPQDLAKRSTHCGPNRRIFIFY